MQNSATFVVESWCTCSAHILSYAVTLYLMTTYIVKFTLLDGWYGPYGRLYTCMCEALETTVPWWLWTIAFWNTVWWIDILPAAPSSQTLRFLETVPGILSLPSMLPHPSCMTEESNTQETWIWNMYPKMTEGMKQRTDIVTYLMSFSNIQFH